MTEYDARLATRVTHEARRRLKLAAAVTGQLDQPDADRCPDPVAADRCRARRPSALRLEGGDVR